MNPGVSLSGIAYGFTQGTSRHVLFRDLEFECAQGSSVAILGRSGSGKSTLLNLIAGLERPTSGTIRVGERELTGLSDRQLTLYRRHEVGMVFQFFNLIDTLNVYDNLRLPLDLIRLPRAEQDSRIHTLLERVGLADRARSTVHQLSGGEMQRVAICRALLRRPKLLLADEPTGNLDDANGRKVMDLLLSLAAEEGSVLIYVTHSQELASLADEQWQIHSGRLEA